MSSEKMDAWIRCGKRLFARLAKAEAVAVELSERIAWQERVREICDDGRPEHEIPDDLEAFINGKEWGSR